jgi:hypothetical protein
MLMLCQENGGALIIQHQSTLTALSTQHFGTGFFRHNTHDAFILNGSTLGLTY